MVVNARDGALLAHAGGSDGQLKMSVVSIGSQGEKENCFSRLPNSSEEHWTRMPVAFPGYKRVASGELTVGKSPAVRRIYSYDGKTGRRQEMSIFIFCPTSAYDLVFEAPAADWTRHQPTFQRIVDSFRWLSSWPLQPAVTSQTLGDEREVHEQPAPPHRDDRGVVPQLGEAASTMTLPELGEAIRKLMSTGFDSAKVVPSLKVECPNCGPYTEDAKTLLVISTQSGFRRGKPHFFADPKMATAANAFEEGRCPSCGGRKFGVRFTGKPYPRQNEQFQTKAFHQAAAPFKPGSADKDPRCVAAIFALDDGHSPEVVVQILEAGDVPTALARAIVAYAVDFYRNSKLGSP